MYKRNDEMLNIGLDKKIIYAVATNDLDTLRYKLKGISRRQLNMKHHIYDNALLLATNDNNIEAAKLLLEAGADTEIKDMMSCTPLAIALKKGREPLAYLLMDYGASICHQSNRKVSILHYAAAGSGRQMIEYLLDKGLDINYLASNNLSTLDFTTNILTQGNLEAAKTLVANGINKEIISKGFKEACWRGNNKIAKILLEASANVEVVMGENKNKPETLFWLCKMPNRLQRTSSLKTIHLLMKEGINFEQQYKFIGQLLDCIGSPLQKAKQEGFTDAVKLIREGQW